MDLTPSARRFADLCRDIYTLAQDIAAPHEARGPERGWHWEERIAATLAFRGYPIDATPGGVRVFGSDPASGLRHQTDAAVICSDAYVIAEWKSYTGAVPKNEVLRFKAATDDLYDTVVRRPPRIPLMRLFGVGGSASRPLRWYAARHGITLVERSRWPAPVLADPRLTWPEDAPTTLDRNRLAWLSRPMQQVSQRLTDGALRLPPPPETTEIDALLALQDKWSERLWLTLDLQPGAFEQYAADLVA